MEFEQETRQKEAERWWEFQRDALGYSKEFGAVVVKSLLLINGGAIIAILSFVSNSKMDEQLKNAAYASNMLYTITFFVAGLILAIATAAVGYINFQYLTYKLPDPSELSNFVRNGDRSGWGDGRWDTHTARFAVLLAFASAVAFVAGAYFALHTLITKGV